MVELVIATFVKEWWEYIPYSLQSSFIESLVDKQ